MILKKTLNFRSYQIMLRSIYVLKSLGHEVVILGFHLDNMRIRQFTHHVFYTTHIRGIKLP